MVWPDPHPFRSFQQSLLSCDFEWRQGPEARFSFLLLFVSWFLFIFFWFASRQDFLVDGLKVVILPPPYFWRARITDVHRQASLRDSTCEVHSASHHSPCGLDLWTAFAPKTPCVSTASELPALWWANHIPPWILAFRKLIIFVPSLVYASCTLKLHNLVRYHPNQTILSVKESCNLYENKLNV